jgi:hypothetical protein
MSLEKAALVYAEKVLAWNELNIQANRSGLREDELAKKKAYNEMCDSHNELNTVAYNLALEAFE